VLILNTNITIRDNPCNQWLKDFHNGGKMVELLYKEQTFAVIGAAMEDHKTLGPGLLEAVYQASIERELTQRGIPVEKKVKLPVAYKDIIVGIYEADLVIDNKFIVEIKAASKFNASHQAQAMHYLAATGLRLALLLNFGTGSLQHHRIIK
jgi:GxxExxY protein